MSSFIHSSDDDTRDLSLSLEKPVFRSLAAAPPSFLSTQPPQTLDRASSLEVADVERAVVTDSMHGGFWESYNKDQQQQTLNTTTTTTRAKELGSLAMPKLSALAPKQQMFDTSTYKLSNPRLVVSQASTTSSGKTVYEQLPECPVWFNKYYSSFSYASPDSILKSLCEALRNATHDFVVSTPSMIEGITRCGMKFSVNLCQFSASDGQMFGVKNFDTHRPCVLVEVNREQGCAFHFSKFYKALTDSYQGMPIVPSVAVQQQGKIIESSEPLDRELGGLEVDSKCLDTLLSMAESEYVGDVAKGAVDTLNQLKDDVADKILQNEELLIRATNVALALVASPETDVRLSASTLLLNLCPWKKPEIQIVESLSARLPGILAAHAKEERACADFDNHKLLAMRRCREQLEQVSRELQVVI